MIAPCRVKTWLYWSAVMIVPPGVRSSVRISSAKTPPRKKLTSTETRYITPIRL